MANSNGRKIEAGIRRRFNWPLWSGLVLVVFIGVLAVIGPEIAPKDPMETNMLLRVGQSQYEVPPFDLLTPGFPLGSDQFGRDLYSRLLWGIRPTMVLVLIVSVIRLITGVVIGLIAGWFKNTAGRMVDGLLETALALPVFLITLATVVAIGPENGLIAFLVGLSLTGWVETAQQVREQTRLISQQTYIEAARALGLSSWQILTRHVLRQIVPLLAIFFAFEVSSSLMLTAGLGFLGYYVGGDEWVIVSDFVAQRTSGAPELGEMLATSWVTLTKPWAMIVVGTTIFLTVLGCNLMGEGLRQVVARVEFRRRTALDESLERAGLEFDERVLHPLRQVWGKTWVRLPVTAAILIGLGYWGFVSIQPFLPDLTDINQLAEDIRGAVVELDTPEPTQTAVRLPVAQAEPIAGLTEVSYSAQISWQFKLNANLTGGPVFHPTGDWMVILSDDGMVRNVTPDGLPGWELQLPSVPIGTPLIPEARSIYVIDRTGGLHAINRTGSLRWSYQSEVITTGVSGPILTPDGNLAFSGINSSQGIIEVVSPDGELVWRTDLNTQFIYRPIKLLNRGYLSVAEDLVHSDSGRIVPYTTDLQIREFQGGLNGVDYVISGNLMMPWEIQNGALTILLDENSGSDAELHNLPENTGVTSPERTGVYVDGLMWKFYTVPGNGGSQIEWYTPGELAPQPVIRIPYSGGDIIEWQADQLLGCGGRPFDPIQLFCFGVSLKDEAEWRLFIDNVGPVVGGAIHEGRYYIASSAGVLYEIAVTKRLTPEDPIEPGEAGLAWMLSLPREVLYGPIRADAENIWVVTEDQHLLKIDAVGQVLINQSLGAGLYVRDEGFSSTTLTPSVLDDGSIIFVNANSEVVNYDPDGNIRWTHQLDEVPYLVVGWALENQPSRFLVVDLTGRLHVFNTEGLAWTYTSSIGDRAGQYPRVAPDGTIYHVVRTSSRAYLTALTSEGEELWVSETENMNTFGFLDVDSTDGILLMENEAFDARTGEKLTLDFPEPVVRLHIGHDGFYYAGNLTTIYKWQLVDSAVEILGEINFEEYHHPAFPFAPYFQVDENSVIWLYSGSNITILHWLQIDGTHLGELPLNNGQLFTGNYELGSEYTYCESDRESGSSPATYYLTCGEYTVGEAEPHSTQTYTGLPLRINGNYYPDPDGDVIYATTARGELGMFRLEISTQVSGGN